MLRVPGGGGGAESEGEAHTHGHMGSAQCLLGGREHLARECPANAVGKPARVPLCPPRPLQPPPILVVMVQAPPLPAPAAAAAAARPSPSPAADRSGTMGKRMRLGRPKSRWMRSPAADTCTHTHTHVAISEMA